jgi:hypothetical protein
MDTNTTPRQTSLPLQVTLWGLVVLLLLLAGWALVGISPLEVAALVLQSIGETWEAIKGFASWLFGPVVALFA